MAVRVLAARERFASTHGSLGASGRPATAATPQRTHLLALARTTRESYVVATGLDATVALTGVPNARHPLDGARRLTRSSSLPRPDDHHTFAPVVAFVTCAAAAGCALLLDAAWIERSGAYVQAAVSLAAAAAVSGWLAGLTLRVAAPHHEREPAEAFPRWLVTASVGGAAALLLARQAISVLPAGVDRETARALLSGPVPWLVGGVAVVLFSILMAAVADAEDPGTHLGHERAASGSTLFGVLSAAGIVAAGAMLLSRDAPQPYTPEGARRALPALRAEATRRPENAEAQLHLAWALMDSGSDDLEEMRGLLVRAVRLDPENTAARNSLGWVLHRLHRYDEAVSMLREAVRLDPELQPAHHNLGWALSNLGHRQYAAAETAYRAAVRLEPRNAGAVSELAWVVFQLGKREEGLNLARQAVSLAPDSARHHNILVDLLKQAGRVEDARAAARQAVRRTPRNGYAWAELGTLAYVQRDYDEAVRAFTRASEIDSAAFNRWLGYRTMFEGARLRGDPAIPVYPAVPR